FDRKMLVSQLKAPDPWLHVYGFIKGSPTATFSTPPVVMRLKIAYAGPVATPLMGVSGATEQYLIEVPDTLRRADAHYLVQINANGGNIVEAGAPGLLLDAEFNGTKLTLSQLDKVWPLADTAASDPATFAALANGPDVLPQSGEGNPGGRFHSWFEVLP
ncbi:MAG: hypothetical protein ABJE10_01950, partial [bacterium]